MRRRRATVAATRAARAGGCAVRGLCAPQRIGGLGGRGRRHQHGGQLAGEAEPQAAEELRAERALAGGCVAGAQLLTREEEEVAEHAQDRARRRRRGVTAVADAAQLVANRRGLRAAGSCGRRERADELAREIGELAGRRQQPAQRPRLALDELAQETSGKRRHKWEEQPAAAAGCAAAVQVREGADRAQHNCAAARLGALYLTGEPAPERPLEAGVARRRANSEEAASRPARHLLVRAVQAAGEQRADVGEAGARCLGRVGRARAGHASRAPRRGPSAAAFAPTRAPTKPATRVPSSAGRHGAAQRGQLPAVGEGELEEADDRRVRRVPVCSMAAGAMAAGAVGGLQPVCAQASERRGRRSPDQVGAALGAQAKLLGEREREEVVRGREAASRARGPRLRRRLRRRQQRLRQSSARCSGDLSRAARHGAAAASSKLKEALERVGAHALIARDDESLRSGAERARRAVWQGKPSALRSGVHGCARAAPPLHRSRLGWTDKCALRALWRPRRWQLPHSQTSAQACSNC